MGWAVLDSLGRFKHVPINTAWKVLDSTGRGKALLDSSMFAGTNWTDLTDGGATTLHTHAAVATTTAFITPGGRLTLVTATPVMITDNSAIGTVFYALYAHDQVPIYDGTNWTNTTFTELSNVLANSATGSAGPAAAAVDQNYDFFVWSNSGTMTLTRGPVWTDGTTRSAGTALTRQNGIWLNNASITNGPAASRGTYVGTMRTIAATATVSWELGGTAANGDPGFLYVWNMYNRIPVAIQVRDNTNSWTHAPNPAAWTAYNSSTSNRVSYIQGLQEDSIQATMFGISLAGAATTMSAGVGIDSTTSPSGAMTTWSLTTNAGLVQGVYAGFPGLGFHFLSGLEFADTITGGTFYGDAGVAYLQSGLHFQGWF